MTALFRRKKDRGPGPPGPFRVRALTPDDFASLVRYDWSPLVAERDTIYLWLARDHARYCFVAEDDPNDLPQSCQVLPATTSGPADPRGETRAVPVRPGLSASGPLRQQARNRRLQKVMNSVASRGRASGRPLGYLVSARSADGKAVFIVHVHVRTRARRRGIGKALVCELERVAREDGVEVVWFLARAAVERFYGALGYEAADDVLPPEALRYVREAKRTGVMAKRLRPE